MVRLTLILGLAKKVQQTQKPERRFLRKGFLDKITFNVRAGTGGSGLPKYGGIGGKGGDVYVKAKAGMEMKSLAAYVKDKELTAGTGYDSSKRGILGEAGEDLVINVPPGVQVFREDGTFLGGVDENGKQLVVALGGKGGCSETDYSPKRGESHAVILDLKLISDVALVGFPNAGKSTLLTSISRAKPKIAAYPFTTLRPHLGKVVYEDFREVTVADLPGLIEGAHNNFGMGHEFLKHLERTKLLLFVIDIEGFKLSPRHTRRSCLETIILLNKEIELYNPQLLDIPAVLLLNKMDTSMAEQIHSSIRPKIENLSNYLSEFPDEICPEKFLKFEEILPMALINKDKKEISELKKVIREVLDKIYEEETLKLEGELPESKLVDKLKRKLKINAPLLV